jgi:hypothetical protein
MKRSGKWRGSDPYQLTIDWNAKPAAGIPAAAIPPMPAPSPKLRLKWDFCTTFPHPTEQAIEAGLIQPEDVDLESIRSIHEEHARELRNTLDDLDAVRSAQRRGVDPASGHPPKTAASRLRLQKLYESEPKRLERWFENLLGVYADAFGPEAAEAFGNAVRAWHAGVLVTTREDPASVSATPPASEMPVTARAKPHRERSRAIARLPVPKPLPQAVAAGNFGMEENGKPVRPGPDEVREITLAHADKLVDLLPTAACSPPRKPAPTARWIPTSTTCETA